MPSQALTWKEQAKDSDSDEIPIGIEMAHVRLMAAASHGCHNAFMGSNKVYIAARQGTQNYTPRQCADTV